MDNVSMITTVRTHVLSIAAKIIAPFIRCVSSSISCTYTPRPCDFPQLPCFEWTRARFKAAMVESFFDSQTMTAGVACAALSTGLTWATLLTGGRTDEEAGVETLCYIFGCLLGLVVGVLSAMLIKSEYPIHETVSIVGVIQPPLRRNHVRLA